MGEKLIFEYSSPGKKGYSLPENDVPTEPVEKLIEEKYLRKALPELPEVSEMEVVRHFTHLSQENYSIDSNFYPLGSCTMKYNPKVNEDVGRLPGFTHIHPLQPEALSQGVLQLLYELEQYLAEISGLSRVSLQPAAGAHGELTGMLMVRAYHQSMGNPRKKVIIPDSAHGTNPASAVLAGYDAVEVKSDKEGRVDLQDLKKVADAECAAFMLTNPNTLGLFEKNILQISRILKEYGILLYLDGANLNAMLGLCRPGDMGFDVVHFNLHKTFSTPHGGGGPGAGPVGVKKSLIPFLPVPTVERRGDLFYCNYERPKSIGKIQGFYGNFGVMVRAYAYIRTLGASGLKEVGENAILNANYMKKRLEGYFDLPYEGHCMHEFVLSAKRQKKAGVPTRDIAKRLLDFSFHPPTIYFPLIVDEALMIEPTETETKETLDRFCDAMIAIAKEIEENPNIVRSAPHTTIVSRLDETRAAKDLDLRWRREG